MDKKLKYLKYKRKYLQLLQKQMTGGGHHYRTQTNGGNRDQFHSSCMWISIQDYFRNNGCDFSLQQLRDLGGLYRNIENSTMFDNFNTRHIEGFERICRIFNIRIDILNLRDDDLLEYSGSYPLRSIEEHARNNYDFHISIVRLGNHFELLNKINLGNVIYHDHPPIFIKQVNNSIRRSLQKVNITPSICNDIRRTLELNARIAKRELSTEQAQLPHPPLPSELFYEEGDVIVYDNDFKTYINITDTERKYTQTFQLYQNQIDTDQEESASSTYMKLVELDDILKRGNLALQTSKHVTPVVNKTDERLIRLNQEKHSYEYLLGIDKDNTFLKKSLTQVNKDIASLEKQLVKELIPSGGGKLSVSAESLKPVEISKIIFEIEAIKFILDRGYGDRKSLMETLSIQERHLDQYSASDVARTLKTPNLKKKQSEIITVHLLRIDSDIHYNQDKLESNLLLSNSEIDSELQRRLKNTRKKLNKKLSELIKLKEELLKRLN